MQGDQGEGILDLAGLEQGEGLIAALDDDLDVFAFIGKAVDAAGLAGIDAAAEEIDGFGRAARAGQEAVDRQDLADDGKPGLLLGFAPRDRAGGVLRVEDSRGGFRPAGGKAGEMRGEAKLLDKYKRVALRIIEQD